jgi:predicted outer membrane protein
MTSRWLKIAALTAAALLAFAMTSAANAQTGSAGAEEGVVAAQGGPLGPADRDFLVKVRQAGLWELPTGRQSLEKSGNRKVKEAGRHLIDGHTLLDNMVRDIATQLGVTLPDTPTSDQQGWLDELARAEGEDYDTVFANRLRAAHGKVYGFAAQIRAGTRNALVRSMATQAMTTVFDHMKVLEATGLVAFEDLPSPSLAATTSSASAAPAGAAANQGVVVQPQAVSTSSSGSGGGMFIAALLLLVLPAGVLVLLTRRRRRPGSR